MPASKMTNYLVFESAPVRPGATVTDSSGRIIQNTVQELVPYTCIGAVRAKNEEDAIRAVIGATRRVGRYAVIEANFLDFTQTLVAPEADAPQLNP